MNTPEQFTEHVHVQFSSCSVHLFLADHEQPPYVHVQFMFSSTSRPRSDFLRCPEGQTTNVLFLEILTRATPHASCIHLSRARTSALHPSPSLSRAHSAPSDQTTHTCRIDSDKYCFRVAARGPPPLLNCTYPSLTRVFSTPTLTCTHPLLSSQPLRCGEARTYSSSSSMGVMPKCWRVSVSKHA